jgi:hypothetical protein
MQALANELMDLRAQVDAVRETGFRIPVLNADPPAGDPTNVWLFADGRLRVRLPNGTVQQVIMTAGGATTSSVAKPANPSPVTYQTEWAAVWTQTYNTAGAQSGTGIELQAGRATDGQTYKAAWSFNTTAARAALAGARIMNAEVFLDVVEQARADARVRIGGHIWTAKPATYPGFIPGGPSSVAPVVPGAQWITVDTRVGDMLRDAQLDGLAIEQGTDDPSYWVRLGGFGGSYGPPRVRLTYVK